MTYHPNVLDRTSAEIIELAPGAESTGIDIQLGIPAVSYTVSGRFVDADTGQPVENVALAVSTYQTDSRRGGNTFTGTSFSGASDAKGEFKAGGFSPGQYSISAGNNTSPPPTTYSDSVKFTVVDSDISDIVVKIHKGATLTGLVVFEDTSPGKTSSRLDSVTVFADPTRPSETDPSQFRSARVNEVGAFILSGLAPGQFLIIAGTTAGTNGARVSRVERDGVPIAKNVITLSPGEQVTGLRIVIEVGTGSLRGTVTIGGMPITPDLQFNVFCRQLGAELGVNSGPRVVVDSRGQFLITALRSGTYEVRVSGRPRKLVTTPMRVLQSSQTVTVVDGVELQVLIDLKPLETQVHP